MFDGFTTTQIAVDGATIHLVHGDLNDRGKPPLLLLHGYPQTHAMWHKLAPRLAERFIVVAPDLRGYGDSSKPGGLPDHSNYSKRVMARDQVDVMRALGFERFSVISHDRGARVAHRMALDHPDRVTKLVTLDIAPTLAMYEQTTMDFARAYYHWFFFIQPAPLPERLIGADPEFYLRQKMGGGSAGFSPFTPEAFAEYVRCFRDPATIHASCEDYRAAAAIDLELDRADRQAGKKVRCPLLALWGKNGVIERCFKPLDDWAAAADDVRGKALPGGHYLAEEVPDLVYDEVSHFLG
jgi:haloacetate dehalogenase